MRFWLQNGHRMAPQTIQKRSKKVFYFSIVFFIDFWIDLGGRNPWKWAPRVHEKLIFIKSPFPILAYFWKQKWWKQGSQHGTKMALKIKQKIRSLFDRFWTYFWRLLGALWGSKSQQKSSRKFSVYLAVNKWVLEPSVEIQGRPQRIWRPAGVPRGKPQGAGVIRP